MIGLLALQMQIQIKDIVQITKEKTALVFSNALQISTKDEKYFITSLNSRDKTYLILSHLWQNIQNDQVTRPGSSCSISGRISRMTSEQDLAHSAPPLIEDSK